MRLSLFALLDTWLAPAPVPARAGWIGAQTFAHRGLHGPGVPENSTAAFARAIKKGLGIECDVQRTADGKAVVFHDWELDRLTGRNGSVADLSGVEVGRIALSENGEAIPSLAQVLDQVAGEVPILIEVKSRRELPVAGLCAAVDRALIGYSGRHAVMSFDPRVSRWFASHAAHTVRGLVVTEEDAHGWAGDWSRHLALWHARPDFLAYDIRDLPAPFPSAQRRRGLAIATWTVRSPDLLERARLHADAPIAEGAGIA